MASRLGLSLFRTTHQVGGAPFVIQFAAHGRSGDRVMHARDINRYLSVARGDAAEAEFETRPGQQPPWYWPQRLSGQFEKA